MEIIADSEKKRDDSPSKVGSEYIAETCFSSYARPGLTFQQRSLMNIGMLIALNRGPELRIHIKAALNNGLSEEQITEACRHAMVYCGSLLEEMHCLLPVRFSMRRRRAKGLRGQS